MWMIFLMEVGKILRDVVESLKKRLEVGCEEKVNFKYIGVNIR